MAYASFDGLATILQRGPAFRATSTAALKVGELVNKEFALADASAGGLPAIYVALETVASGGSVLLAEWAVLRKPSTIGAGGAVTAGSHGGTLGDTLFLSTTAGDAVEVIDGDGIYQIVGQALSTQDVLIRPSTAPGDFFEDCENETGAKTADVNDSGKALVCTSTTDIVVTLQATAVGDTLIVVNGAQDGDHLVSISPNASDGIAGWDFTASDDGDATNTKATSKAGDYLEIVANGAAGWQVVSGRGVWAGA
tara:strand:- start:8180 stop:8938 length:759 start_codon:yes stop_codon:yes gene_type:complete